MTLLPQPGNPKPRVFRLTADFGVINRCGFNSMGANAVEDHLKAFRLGEQPKLQQQQKKEEVSKESANDKEGEDMAHRVLYWIRQTAGEWIGRQFQKLCAPLVDVAEHKCAIVGLNVGMNKGTLNEVEVCRHLWRTQGVLLCFWILSFAPVLKINAALFLFWYLLSWKLLYYEQQQKDYVKVIRQLGPYIDYIVINVSSPNTPGLRNLQKLEALQRLLTAAMKERDALPSRFRGKRGVVEGKDVPLLVKISPDLTEEEMKDIAKVATECTVDGLVVANTTTSRPSSLLSIHKHEAGGLSGTPLRQISTECIRTMYRLTNGNIPIIGVGGVGSGQDVYDKLRAGASLVQLYTMMTFEGPGLVSRIRNELNDILHENGHKRVEDAIGLDHEMIYWRKKKEQLQLERSKESVITDE